jgi:hypothetical protein
MRVFLKKTVAYVLAFVMVFSLSSVSFAGDNMTITLKGGTLTKGSQIVVPVTVSNNKGIGAADLQIIYDSKNLKIKNITADYSDIDGSTKYGLLFGFTPNSENGKVTWAKAYANSQNGELFWIVFETQDNVMNGKYSISMTHITDNSNNMFSDGESHEILDSDVTVNPATITVTGGTDPVATTIDIAGGPENSTAAVPTKSNKSTALTAFTATVKDQQGGVMNNAPVTWSIENAPEGVSINGSTGVVTVTNKASAGDITVKATSGSASKTVALNITKDASVVDSIEIFKDGAAVSGSTTITIPTGSTANSSTFTAKVYDQYGEDITSKSGAVTWTLPTESITGVTVSDHSEGGKNVSVSSDTTDNASFTIKATVGEKSSEITVNLKAISVTWPTVKTKNAVYGNAWGDIITLSGGSASLDGQAVSGNFSVRESGTKPEAGSQTYTIVFNSNDNKYTVEKSESTNIEQRTATLSWSGDSSLTYDGSAKNVTAAVSNLVSGDTCNVTVTGGTETAAGSHTATANALSNTNYKLPASASKSYTIAPADYTVTLNNTAVSVKEGTGSTEFLPEASAKGVGSEVPTGTLKYYTDENRSTEVTADAISKMSIGTHKLYWKFTLGTDDVNANYVSTPKTGEITLNITDGDPQNITISGVPESITYGDNAFKLTADVKTTGGAEAEDHGSITWASSDSSVVAVDSTGNVTVKGAGSATVTAKAARVAGKYAAGEKTASITVKPKTVGITWSGYENLTYDNTEKNVTALVTAGDLVSGDTCTVTVTGGQETNAGTYTATAASLSNANYSLPTAVTQEYTIAKASRGAITVTPAEIELTPVSKNQQLTVSAANDLDKSFAAAVSYSSNNTKAVSVNATGLVNALANGIATVTVKVAATTNYTEASETVTVTSVTEPITAVGVSGEENDKLTAELSGTNIIVSGIAASESTVTVTYTKADNSTGTVELTYSDGKFSGTPIELNGVTYTIQTTDLITLPGEVTVEAGQNDVPEVDLPNVSDAAKLAAQNAAKSVKSGNLIAAASGIVSEIAAKAESLIAGSDKIAEEDRDKYEVKIEIYTKIEVKGAALDNTENKKLKLDITPMYNVNAVLKSGETGDDNIALQQEKKIDNSKLTAAVNIEFTLPSEFVSSTTDRLFANHYASDGSNILERLRVGLTEENGSFKASMKARSFSEFEFEVDSRAVDITYKFTDGTEQTVTYDSADIGTSLPSDSKDGYTFKGWAASQDAAEAAYTGTLTDAYLTALTTDGATKAELYPVFTNKTYYTTSPGGGGGSSVITYKVVIDTCENGSVTADKKSAEAAKTVTLTAVPDSGYAVSSITVTDAEGKAVDVTKSSDNIYTFNMPKSNVTVKAEFKTSDGITDEVKEPADVFNDVSKSDWFYDAVNYALEKGYFKGMSETVFAPKTSITRAQFVQVLSNISGADLTAYTTSSFNDVEIGTWYQPAVEWAYKNSVVSGIGDGRFGPNVTITREQMAKMLRSYLASTGADVSNTDNAKLDSFSDASQVSDWAKESLAWAVNSGVINGTGSGVAAKSTATRAQTCQILMNYFK